MFHTPTTLAEEHAAQELAERLHEADVLDAAAPARERSYKSGGNAIDEPEVAAYTEFDSGEGYSENRSFEQRPVLDIRRVLLVAGSSFTALAVASLITTQNGPLSAEHLPEPGRAVAPSPSVAVEPSTPSADVEPPSKQNDSVVKSSGTDTSTSQPAVTGKDSKTGEQPSRVQQTSSSRPSENISPRFAAAPRPVPPANTNASAPPASNTTPAVSASAPTAGAGPSEGTAPVQPRAAREIRSRSAEASPTALREEPFIGSVSRRSTAMVSPSMNSSGYTNVTGISGGSQHEIDRISRALDAGDDNGRHRAELYQQRALLYLNRNDNGRATQDFRRAIDAFNARIRAGDRVAEAKTGLAEAQKGLKQASDTIVY